MLINFKASNILSIKDEINLSLQSNEDIINILGFYGNTSSGKTNVIKALHFMQNYVFNSNNLKINQTIPLQKFKYDEEKEISEFEITILVNKIKYKYGFVTSTSRIHEEYLYYYENEEEKLIFERRFNTYNFEENQKQTLSQIKESINQNQLFLSVFQKINNKLTTPVYYWFINNLKTVYFSSNYKEYTIERISQKDKKINKFITNMLKRLDETIEEIDVKVKELTYEDLKKHPIYENIKHNLVNANKDSIKGKETNINICRKINKKTYTLNLNEESEGIQNLFYLSGLIYDSLSFGKTIIIDDIEKNIPNTMIKSILNMFSDKKINKTGAQLIFTTNNQNLLNREILKKDQIWYVEKDKENISTIIYK